MRQNLWDRTLVQNFRKSFSNQACDYEPISSLPIKSVSLMVSQYCNMSCIYCYGGMGEYSKKSMMSEKIAIHAVNWLMEQTNVPNDINVTFFGGEPLLNFKTIKNVVNYVNKKSDPLGISVRFGLTTNGTIYSDFIFDFLAENNFNILISIDGPKKIHDKQRRFKNGKPTYDKVFFNLKKIKDKIKNVRGRSTLCFDTNPKIVKNELNALGLFSYQISKATTSFFQKSTQNYTHTNNILYKDYIREELKDATYNIKNRNLKKDGMHNILGALIDKEKVHYGCGLGKASCAISTNGDIYPCHRYVGYKNKLMGNILSSKRLKTRNAYYSNIVEKSSKCSYCWARFLCGGGCAYNNEQVTGRMHMPDQVFCSDTKYFFEELITIVSNLDTKDFEYVSNTLKN